MIIRLFPLKWASFKMNQSFLFSELLCVFSAMAILEPQIYVVVEQFGAENISLLSGRLVFNPHELVKLVLQKFYKIVKCTIWPSEPNYINFFRFDQHIMRYMRMRIFDVIFKALYSNF